MTASSEDRDQQLPARLGVPLLLMMVGFVTVYGLLVNGLLVNGLLAMNTLWGSRGWQVLGALASNLLVIGAIWGLSRLKPSRQRIAVLSLLLGFAAVLGFGAATGVVKNALAVNLARLWYWKTLGLIAANLLVCSGAIWGLLRVKPWQAFQGPGEPVSPATRRTNRLFGISGLFGTLGMLALIFGTHTRDKPVGVFSNSSVSLGIALFVIATWLVSNAIAWWWYYSADEHERRANDVGFLAGGGLFITVTPIWWVAARAGLLPEPDAMILWFVFVVAMTIGWAWHRNR